MDNLNQTRPEVASKPETLDVRLQLTRRQAFAVARERRIKVLNGTAWVSYAGKDVILGPGRELHLNAADKRAKAVVSAAGRQNAEVEIYSLN